jgi:hypothetical protein
MRRNAAMSEVYQRGSIRKVPRAKGCDVWEWRYQVNGKQRQQMFPVADYPTEKALWKYLAGSIDQLNGEQAEPVPLVTTMGGIIERYREEVLSELAKSTQSTEGSMLTKHIEPRWASTAIADVKPMAVMAWLKTLTLSSWSPSRGRPNAQRRLCC